MLVALDCSFSPTFPEEAGSNSYLASSGPLIADTGAIVIAGVIVGVAIIASALTAKI